MAILIDPPLWPAHGTLWSHLISDADYDELHVFAARLGLPRRSFDLDHYDVPMNLHARAVALGATAVGTRDVVRSLRDSGLRVRQVRRATERPVRRRQYLLAEWGALGDSVLGSGSSAARGRWADLGDELIVRWNEPHRRYHDERHLEDVLLALDHLAVRGERVSASTLMAAWFHDAVYLGRSGADERESAELAEGALTEFDVDQTLVSEVGELIRATEPGIDHEADPGRAVHLLDADLSIFAAAGPRYLQYSSAVRAEYAHVSEDAFREGRARILVSYLDRPTIYRTETARHLWEERARANLLREIGQLGLP